MRVLSAILCGLTLAAPSSAQWMPAPAPVLPSPPVFAAPWRPTADYIEPGQDEPGYRLWAARGSWRLGQVRQFHDYLTASGVSFVAPTWQLLRTASDWRRCGAEPFEIPPQDEWPNIVNTLRYVRDYVVPAIGAVEPVSVFRNSTLNRCAGGAPESVHQSMSAIDFVPLHAIGRSEMIRRLCAQHQAQGPRFNAGLGFYSKMRFHVDSWRYRTWGRNDNGEVACPKVEWQAPVLASTPVRSETPTATTVPAAPPVSVTTIPEAIISNPPAAVPPPAPSPIVETLPKADPLAPL